MLALRCSQAALDATRHPHVRAVAELAQAVVVAAHHPDARDLVEAVRSRFLPDGVVAVVDVVAADDLQRSVVLARAVARVVGAVHHDLAVERDGDHRSAGCGAPLPVAGAVRGHRVVVRVEVVVTRADHEDRRRRGRRHEDPGVEVRRGRRCGRRDERCRLPRPRRRELALVLLSLRLGALALGLELLLLGRHLLAQALVLGSDLCGLLLADERDVPLVAGDELRGPPGGVQPPVGIEATERDNAQRNEVAEPHVPIRPRDHDVFPHLHAESSLPAPNPFDSINSGTGLLPES